MNWIEQNIILWIVLDGSVVKYPPVARTYQISFSIVKFFSGSPLLGPPKRVESWTDNIFFYFLGWRQRSIEAAMGGSAQRHILSVSVSVCVYLHISSQGHICLFLRIHTHWRRTQYEELFTLYLMISAYYESTNWKCALKSIFCPFLKAGESRVPDKQLGLPGNLTPPSSAEQRRYY